MIFRRHDYARNFIAKHVEKTFRASSTDIEPTPGSVEDDAKKIIRGNTFNDASADIAVGELWISHKTTFIDVCIVSLVCYLHNDNPVSKTISNAELRKANCYNDMMHKTTRQSFLPFCNVFRWWHWINR